MGWRSKLLEAPTRPARNQLDHATAPPSRPLRPGHAHLACRRTKLTLSHPNFAGEAPANHQQITSKSADPSDLAGEYPPLRGIHHQQSQDHEMAHIYNDLP